MGGCVRGCVGEGGRAAGLLLAIVQEQSSSSAPAKELLLPMGLAIVPPLPKPIAGAKGCSAGWLLPRACYPPPQQLL